MGAAVAAGVDWVQLRDRSLGGAALLDAARAFRHAAVEGWLQRHEDERRAGPCTLLLNRRLDVALALLEETSPEVQIGLHLGFDSPPLDAALGAMAPFGGAAGPIGVAAHSVEDVGAAATAGAGYAHLAPIFEPLSKPASRAPLGTDALARASHSLGRPVPESGETGRCLLIAQGGIEGERAAGAIRAGADGVAVTGAILGATHPGDAAARLRATLDGALGSG